MGGVFEVIVIWATIMVCLGGIPAAFYYGRKLWFFFKKNLDIYKGV